MMNLVVEFVVPSYFLTLLDWSDGIGGIVYWLEGDNSIGDLYRYETSDGIDMIEVRESDKPLCRGYIENVKKIVIL